MRELQDCAKRLERENDRLWAQVEERHNLGKKDAQDRGQTKHLTVSDKGKKPIVPDNIDTPADDELSSGGSPNLSPEKSNRARLRQRHSHRPAFNNTDNGLLHRARGETGRKQSQPNDVPKNMYALPKGVVPMMLSVYPAFDTAPTPYMPPVATSRSPDDMLSSPLGQHILDYEPPRGFFIPTFTMFDGSTDPYDHMLQYNQVMTLNADNDLLLCKVFSASLRGPALAWIHKLP